MLKTAYAMKKYCPVLVPRHVTILLLIVCAGHMILLLNWVTSSVILDTNPMATKLQIHTAGDAMNDHPGDESISDSVYTSKIPGKSGFKIAQGVLPAGQSLIGRIRGVKYSKDMDNGGDTIKQPHFRIPSKVQENNLVQNHRHSKLKESDKIASAYLQYGTKSRLPLSDDNQRVKTNETDEVRASNEIWNSLLGVKSRKGEHQMAVNPKLPNKSQGVNALWRPGRLWEFSDEQRRDYQPTRRRGLSYAADTVAPGGIKAALRNSNTTSSVHRADEIAFSSETHGSNTRSNYFLLDRKKWDPQAGPSVMASIKGVSMEEREKRLRKKPLAYSDMALQLFYSDREGDVGINFQYFITPQFLCEISEDSPNGVDMVTTVHSHPGNRAQRDAIRSTWGRVVRDYDRLDQIRLVFVLGMAGAAEQEDLISREAKLYNDLLAGVFQDSYENLSVKSLYAMNWVANHCPNARYMLKTDDDTYLNLPLLMQHPVIKDQNKNFTAIGAVNSKSPVLRSGLWQVSMTSFPFEYYPQYCTGCAYILSTSILAQLLSVSRRAALIPVEDAYVTGILVTLLGHKCINLEQFPQWFMGPSHANICQLMKGRLFGLHNVPYEAMYRVHEKLTSGNHTMCPS